MSALSSIIEEVAAAAEADTVGSDPKAHTKLLQTIQKLTLAAERPSETIKRILYQPPTNIALRIAVEVGLLGVVGAADSSPITVQELAKSCNVEELLVVRVMRALVAMGICDEDGPYEYLSNEVTREFISGGFENGVKFLYDTVMPAAANIVDYLKQIGFRSPKHQHETPFAHAEKAALFEWMKKYPEQRGYFDNFMAGRRRETLRWFDIYPAAENLTSGLRSGPQDVLIVDIGGSHGHDLISFKARHNELSGRCILQDLPETIDSIQNPLSGIEAMAYDFFTPQPVINSRVYFLGTVCHDWADEACIKFLSNTAKVMEKDYSTLLIYDHVVPETGASIRATELDLQMMCLFAGIERTQGQWRGILDASGLEMVQIWYSATQFESVIEARRK